MEFKNEKQIAKRAEQMLTTSLQSKTSGFASHAGRSDEDQSLKDAFALTKVKRYGKGRGNIKLYMTSLSIKMTKHGFIQHYGINNVRDSGSRTRKKPKETTYNFASHYYKMKAQPFIKSAIDQSGVIPFVMAEITKHRSEEFLVEVRRIIENQ